MLAVVATALAIPTGVLIGWLHEKKKVQRSRVRNDQPWLNS